MGEVKPHYVAPATTLGGSPPGWIEIEPGYWLSPADVEEAINHRRRENQELIDRLDEYFRNLEEDFAGCQGGAG